MTVLVRIHPEVAAVIDDIVAAIHKEFGELIERIVLLGPSSGAGYQPGISAIDLAVLVTAYPPEYNVISPAMFTESMTALHLPAECHVLRRDQVERWRAFKLCNEGLIARGLAIYDAKRPFSGIVLSSAAAKAEIIASYMRKSLQRIEHFGTAEFVIMECCYAVCQALHAIWTRHEIDFTPLNIRWDLDALFQKALILEPSLAVIRPTVRYLKLLNDDPAPGDVDRSELTNASHQCVVSVGDCLGITGEGNS